MQTWTKILLALLLFSSPAWSQDDDDTVAVGQIIAAGACSTPSIGANFTEGFETATTGYEQTGWTAIGSPNPAASLPASLTDGCSQGFYVNVSGSNIGAYNDNGSAIDVDTVDVDFVSWVYVTTASDENETFTIMAAHTGTDLSVGSPNRLTILNDAIADIRVRCAGSTDSTFVVLTAGNWYKLTMHLDTTAESSYCRVEGGGSTTCDAVDECAFTRNAGDPRYFFIGGPYGVAGNDSGQITFDLVSY